MACSRRCILSNADADTPTEDSSDSKSVHPCATEAILNINLGAGYKLRMGAPQLPGPAAAGSGQTPLPDSVRKAPKTAFRNPVAHTADGDPIATVTAAANKALVGASCTHGATSSAAHANTFSHAHSQEQLAIIHATSNDTDAATKPGAGIAAGSTTNPQASLTPLASMSAAQNNSVPSITTSGKSPSPCTTAAAMKVPELGHHRSTLLSEAAATSTPAPPIKVNPGVTFELPGASATVTVQGTFQTAAALTGSSPPSRRATPSDSGASVATEDMDSSEEAETVEAPLLSAYVAIMPSAGDAPPNEHIRLAAKRQRSSTDGPLRPTPHCLQGTAGAQPQQASLTAVGSGHSSTAHPSAIQPAGVGHVVGSGNTTGPSLENLSVATIVGAASLPSAVPQRRRLPQPQPHHQQQQQPKRRTGDWDRLPSVSAHTAGPDQVLPLQPSVRVCSKRYSTPGTPAAIASTVAGCCKSDDEDDNEDGDEAGFGGIGGGGVSGAIDGSGGGVSRGLRLPPLRIACNKLRRSSVDGDRRLRPRPAGHSLFTDSQDEFDWQKFSRRALAVNERSAASNFKGVPSLFDTRAVDVSESPSPDFSPPIWPQCDKLVLTDPRDGADLAEVALLANAVGSGHLRNDGTWANNSIITALSLRINVTVAPGSPVRGTPTGGSSSSPRAPDEARVVAVHSPKALPTIPICAPPTRGPSFTASTPTTTIPSPSPGSSPAPPPLPQALSPLLSSSPSSLPSISSIRLAPQNETSPTLSTKGLFPLTPVSPKFHRLLPQPPPATLDACPSQPAQLPATSDPTPHVPYLHPHPPASPAPQQSPQQLLQSSPAGSESDTGPQRRRQPAPPSVPRPSCGGRVTSVGEEGGHRASQS